MALKPKVKPLSVTVTRNGVLRIEIGIATLATAATQLVLNEEPLPARGGVSNERGFAADVVLALEEEREDGSSILTDCLDAAFRKAIDDGSEHFIAQDDGGESR